MKKIIFIMFLIPIGFMACKKNDNIKGKNYEKELIGKWTQDSNRYVYTDFDGVDQISNDYGWDAKSDENNKYFIDFRVNGKAYRTTFVVNLNVESQDYSPRDWGVSDKILSLKNNRTTDTYPIIEMKKNKLVFDQVFSNITDTFRIDNIPVGKIKSYRNFYSK